MCFLLGKVRELFSAIKEGEGQEGAERQSKGSRTRVHSAVKNGMLDSPCPESIR